MFRYTIMFLILLSLGLQANFSSYADKVIIKKSTRMLYLSSGGHIFKRFHVSLGTIPVGAKEVEGDLKTPEGKYILDWRQTSKKYNKSIHISYPNKKDEAHAKQLGASAGGMIMIHGTPSSWGLSPIGDWMPMLTDWTEGCIAMSNDDLEEVWNQTTKGTPIIIIP
ncbi:MAG: hypothetical protein DSZ11_02305 [Sulfurovum sp.]|nr:MAG: hypothetical protein DSZ11_02305 [Sulfurovum sp.]